MRKFFALLVLIGILLVVVLTVIPHPGAVYSLITAEAPPALPVPVQGVSLKAIVDSWGSPRGRDRQHRGVDIFAKRGTPVLAPVRGLIIGIGGEPPRRQ